MPLSPSVPPAESAGSAAAGGRLFSRTDVVRAAVLVLVAAGIGAGLNLVRKPPLPWNYQTKGERLEEETAALAAGGGRGGTGGRGDGMAGQGSDSAAFPRVALGELRALLADGKGLVIDARPALLFRTGHVPEARNLPRAGFQASYSQVRAVLERDRNQPVVIYCGGGSCEDSDLIAAALRSLGFTRVSVFAGGWREWQAAGLPVETGGGAVP